MCMKSQGVFSYHEILYEMPTLIRINYYMQISEIYKKKIDSIESINKKGKGKR